MPINHHSGSASPDYGDYPEAKVMFLVEVTWWAHRTLWHLDLRRRDGAPPDAAVRVHRAGHRVAARAAAHARLLPGPHVPRRPARRSTSFGAEVMSRLSLKPSEYWARQCHVGVELHPPARGRACAHAVGVDRIMWGSDFPHREGCWPYSHEHLRLAFAGVPADEVAAMVGGNAAARVRLRSRRARAGRGARRADRSTRSPGRSRSTRSRTTRCAVRPSRRRCGRPREERAHDHGHRRVRYGARTPEQMREPRGEGHLGRCVVDVARRDLRDRPRASSPRCCRRRSSRPTEPLVRVSIASVDLGRPACRRSVPARSRCRRSHEGTVGNYPLVMPMTTEQSVIGGRETFGEPKKLGRGRARPRRRPGAGHGHPARHDVHRADRARSARPSSTDRRERTDFYFKFLPAPDGKGFDTEPALVYCHRDETTREASSRRRRDHPARVAVRPGRRPARAPDRRA